MSIWSRRVLSVMEESELGCTAAAAGVELATRLSVPITFLIGVEAPHVETGSVELLLATESGYEKDAAKKAEPWFERAKQIAARAGVRADTALVIDRELAEGVLRVAAQRQCGIIVVGSHGHGTVLRALTGSLVKELVRLSPVPVLVVRQEMADLSDSAA